MEFTVDTSTKILLSFEIKNSKSFFKVDSSCSVLNIYFYLQKLCMFIKKYKLTLIFLFMNIFFLPVFILPLPVSVLFFGEIIELFRAYVKENLL